MAEKSRNDELLAQGPREAPEPETAEERSKRRRRRSGAGIVAGGGLAAAKFAGLAKILLWLVAWHAAVNAWRVGSWLGIALVIAAVTAVVLVRRLRSTG